MKKFSKILSMLVTGVLIGSLAVVPASAEESTTEGLTKGSSTLSFTKDVILAKDGVMPDETFEFTMTPIKADAYKGAAPENLTAYDGVNLAADAAGLKESLSFDATSAVALYDATRVKLEDTGKFDLSYLETKNLNPGVYYYEVKETEGTNTKAITYDKSVYQVEVAINGDGKIAYTKSITDITGNGDWGKKPIVFTNTCKTDTLTIAKTVTGSAGDKTKQFNFSLDIPVKGTNIDLDADAVFTGTIHRNTGKDETLDVTVGGENKFTLADGESLVISGVPEGMIYTVSELDDKGNAITDSTKFDYTCQITGAFSTVEGSSSQLAPVTGYVWDATAKNTPIVDGGNTITFTNNKDMVSPTGIALNLAPYAAAILVAVLGAVALFVRKRNSAK